IRKNRRYRKPGFGLHLVQRLRSFLIAQRTKSLVIERFNREACIWDEVHTGDAKDIIQREVALRKAFTRRFISSRFQNRSAAILEIGCGAGRNLEEILSG